MQLPPNFADTLRIPTLPASVMKVRELLTREDVGTSDVAMELAKDPPLAVKVLRIANSVQYGAREPRTSVQAAASVLGLRAIASIVLRAGVLSAFDDLKDVADFSVTSIWRHSILTAHAAEELARVMRRRLNDFTPQDCYTCGLVHDIGQIVLFDNFGLEYVQLLTKRAEGETQVQAEAAALLGLDHAEVGGRAAGSVWRLPPPIPDLIRFHHRPAVMGPLRDLVDLVICADRIAHLVLENPQEEIRHLARRLESPLPGSTPTMIADVLQIVRGHCANLEI